MKKSLSFILLFLILCLCCCTGTAERKTVEKDRYYLGAMRVVKCRDYVSLREAPYKTATVLAKVPLDSIVLYCNNNVAKYAPSNYKKQAKLFIRCEYDGMEGYILKQYLKPAPEAEPEGEGEAPAAEEPAEGQAQEQPSEGEAEAEEETVEPLFNVTAQIIVYLTIAEKEG